jgi:hypothetical protein
MHDDPRAAPDVEQHGVGRDPAVGEPLPVDVLERLRDLPDQVGGLAGGHRAVGGHPLAQAPPLDEPPRHVGAALDLADLVDRDQVHVLQRRRRGRVVEEPPDLLGGGGPPGEDDLQRYRPVEALLVRLEEDAVGPARDLLDDAEIGEAVGRLPPAALPRRAPVRLPGGTGHRPVLRGVGDARAPRFGSLPRDGPTG